MEETTTTTAILLHLRQSRLGGGRRRRRRLRLRRLRRGRGRRGDEIGAISRARGSSRTPFLAVGARVRRMCETTSRRRARESVSEGKTLPSQLPLQTAPIVIAPGERGTSNFETFLSAILYIWFWGLSQARTHGWLLSRLESFPHLAAKSYHLATLSEQKKSPTFMAGGKGSYYSRSIISRFSPFLLPGDEDAPSRRRRRGQTRQRSANSRPPV